MAGSKRNKIKKALSPTKKSVEPPLPPVVDDGDLMDDLFAQLDSKDKAAQETPAEILKDASIDSAADNLEKESKKDSKARHKARQVRYHFICFWSSQCLHGPLKSMLHRQERQLL